MSRGMDQTERTKGTNQDVLIPTDTDMDSTLQDPHGSQLDGQLWAAN